MTNIGNASGQNSSPGKEELLSRINQWTSRLHGFCRVMEKAAAAGVIVMLVCIPVAIRTDTAWKEMFLNRNILKNYSLTGLWANKLVSALLPTAGAEATFWIVYAFLIAMAVLTVYLLHQASLLSSQILKQESPFSSGFLPRVRRIFIGFFILCPSIMSALVLFLVYLLFKYGIYLQQESDDTV